jgi:hypothetical protein
MPRSILGGVGVGGELMLRWVFKALGGVYGLYSYIAGQDTMLGCYETSSDVLSLSLNNKFLDD